VYVCTSILRDDDGGGDIACSASVTHSVFLKKVKVTQRKRVSYIRISHAFSFFKARDNSTLLVYLIVSSSLVSHSKTNESYMTMKSS
jgi:hypothetical protein